jgi:hypothetical protein
MSWITWLRFPMGCGGGRSQWLILMRSRRRRLEYW